MNSAIEYQALIKKSDACELKAIEFKEDSNLKAFWHNASVAFKDRALSLIQNVGEAIDE